MQDLIIVYIQINRISFFDYSEWNDKVFMEIKNDVQV